MIKASFLPIVIITMMRICMEYRATDMWLPRCTYANMVDDK